METKMVHKRRRVLGLVTLVSLLGCGNNGGSDDEVASGSSSSSAEGNTEVGTTNGETGSSTADTTAGTDTTGTAGTTAGTDDVADDVGEGPKFDLGGVPDAGGMNCGGGEQFSYLWAANSEQGTISKIETATVVEVGRYAVRPDLQGSPSRTSVSLSGNVAVANRNGGVTKIWANPENCEESNGMPGIQTSNSAAYLPWGQEECIAWYTPFGYTSQRPVAWAPGEYNAGTCSWDDEMLWTSGNIQNGIIDVLLLDGETGTVEETIAIPTGGNSLIDDFYGIYGGAVDGDGNFWGSQLGGTRVVRVDRQTFDYEVLTPPANGGYGMTVDVDGMVWLCGWTAARYDPNTQIWQTIPNTNAYAGCMADANEGGLIWMGGGQSIVGINRSTLLVEKTCPVESYGISIDFEGYVWGVAFGSLVSKVDPETCQTWTYNGLVGAYTYSDMTGYALSNAGTPSG